MVRQTITNPLTAGLAVALGGYGLQNVLDVWPCLLVSTGHDGRAVTGTLLTSRDTGSDESDALLGEVFGSSVGVGVVRVAAINDDVALLGTGLEDGLDEGVDGCAGLHEQHHAAGFLQLGDEVLDAVSADDGLALGFVCKEGIDLGDCAVECHDSEAVVSHVENQVLAHDGQANEAEVTAAGMLELCTASRYGFEGNLKRVSFSSSAATIPGGRRSWRSWRGVLGWEMECLRWRGAHDGGVESGRVVN
jgi:hypothetical protein